MPIRTARKLGTSLIAGALAGMVRWLASSVVIGATLAAIVYFIVKQVWPSAAAPSAFTIFFGFPVVLLPVIWSNAIRCGVAAALRDSGLSRTIADVLVAAAARTNPNSEVRIDLIGIDTRIHGAVYDAVPVRPLWFRKALTRVIARRVSREMLGRLRDDLTAAAGSEPEVLRDRVAESIETLTGDWAARRRAA